MIEKLKTNRKNLQRLMIMSFVIAVLGGQDAVTSTILYNQLDKENAIDFRIEKKYNKKKREIFPNLNFKGKIITTGEKREVRVSRGDFDNHMIGEIIKVFKTNSDEFMTQYEIRNQKIIHIGSKGFSFVFIPAFIFFIVGLFSLFVVLKTREC